ncbi:hypothetical protein JCM10212_000994 [Sporobolomyces blumeae]
MARSSRDASHDKWSTWNRLATDMDTDWVNLDDLQVFKNALSEDADNPSSATSPLDPAAQQTPPPVPATEKIRAVSDFAPIRERVRK